MHDAFEITRCSSGSYASSKLTPSTTVTSGSFAGAETITLRAPASRCFAASARLRKKPGRLDHDVDAELGPRQRWRDRPRRRPGSRRRRRRARRRRPRSCRERPVDACRAGAGARASPTPIRSLSADPLDVEPALVRRAEGGATRPPEAVDRNSYSHGSSFVGFSRPTLGRAPRERHRRKRGARLRRTTDARAAASRRSRRGSSSTRPPATPAMTSRSSRRAVFELCGDLGGHARLAASRARRASRPAASAGPPSPGGGSVSTTRCSARQQLAAARRRRSRSASRSAAGSCRRSELLPEEARVRLRLAATATGPRRGRTASR